MTCMAERPSPTAFPLRLRDPRVPALLREVAAREHISQNELVDQALEHALSLRGARLAEDLAAAAERLAQLSDSEYEGLVDASIEAFAAGEAEPEPLQAYALHAQRPDARRTRTASDPLGVLAAFDTGND